MIESWQGAETLCEVVKQQYIFLSVRKKKSLPSTDLVLKESVSRAGFSIGSKTKWWHVKVSAVYNAHKRDNIFMCLSVNGVRYFIIWLEFCSNIWVIQKMYMQNIYWHNIQWLRKGLQKARMKKVKKIKEKWEKPPENEEKLRKCSYLAYPGVRGWHVRNSLSHKQLHNFKTTIIGMAYKGNIEIWTKTNMSRPPIILKKSIFSQNVQFGAISWKIDILPTSD